jgi:hypothetical protein
LPPEPPDVVAVVLALEALVAVVLLLLLACPVEVVLCVVLAQAAAQITEATVKQATILFIGSSRG